MRVIGLISGTSFDGIDVAVADLDLDGDTVTLQPVTDYSVPYEPELAEAILDALPPASTTAEQLCRLDTRIGQAFAAAAAAAAAALQPPAELVVSHGQTLFHWVEDRTALGTLQLGEPAWIAERTGLPVVAGLRTRDVAAGGHGAPLVSILDVLLLGARPGRPRAALNLGGIANLTILGPDRPPVAFDTGPANALMDAAVVHATGGRERYDTSGARAARGRVDEALLGRLLADPYYRLEPPKSTGKEHFHLPYLLDVVGDRQLAEEDLLATLAALTARTVGDACRRARVHEVVAAGGGTRNVVLMELLRRQLPDVAVRVIDEFGLPADAKEAYAFALLGFLSVHGLPATVPSCTGARHASRLGSLVPGHGPLVLPHPATTAPSRLHIASEPAP